MNNRTLIIITSILVLLLIIVGALLLLKANTTSSPAQSVGTNSSSEFPLSNANSSNSQSVSKTGIMTVALQNGSSIVTADFIHNGVTIEDPENTGNYYLAGSIGYCLSNGSCPSGATSTEYHVVYFSQDKSFIISLVSEPLGQARLDAEQFLMKTLGLTQQQMCDLKYNVLTTSSVNSEYAGEDLGFSFCPGAVQLP